MIFYRNVLVHIEHAIGRFNCPIWWDRIITFFGKNKLKIEMTWGPFLESPDN